MCSAFDFHANNTGHTVLAQTFEPLLDQITAPDAAPTSVTVAAGNGKAVVKWVAPPSDGPGFTGYAVTPYINGVAQIPRAYTTTATTRTITGLTNGQSYTFTVAATNMIGTGPQSDPSIAVIIGAPAAPKKVSVASHSTTTPTGVLTVTYSSAYNPVVNNGSPITHVSTTCESSDGGVMATGGYSGSGTPPITVVGTTGATYSCTITATNSRGAGPTSAASNAVMIGAPAAPMTPGVVNVAPGSLKITVKAPANNGDPLTGETATCTSSNGGVTASNTGAASPIIVTGLTVGATYKCTIRATNTRGSGPSSPASKAVTA
jgi:hypothetical protein